MAPFDESGSGRMVAWWNVDPKDWEHLYSGSPSLSPAVEGQGILELGQAPMDTCTFSISFTVPESAPGGPYPIVVLQEGGDGAALEGSVLNPLRGIGALGARLRAVGCGRRSPRRRTC
jgi:hypothetical protein